MKNLGLNQVGRHIDIWCAIINWSDNFVSGTSSRVTDDRHLKLPGAQSDSWFYAKTGGASSKSSELNVILQDVAGDRMP